MGKKFEIISEQASEHMKFVVISELPVVRPTRSHELNGKFKTTAQTRPKKCPYCLTSEEMRPGNIYRMNEHTWGCKHCGYIW